MFIQPKSFLFLTPTLTINYAWDDLRECNLLILDNFRHLCEKADQRDECGKLFVPRRTWNPLQVSFHTVHKYSTVIRKITQKLSAHFLFIYFLYCINKLFFVFQWKFWMATSLFLIHVKFMDALGQQLSY